MFETGEGREGRDGRSASLAPWWIGSGARCVEAIVKVCWVVECEALVKWEMVCFIWCYDNCMDYTLKSFVLKSKRKRGEKRVLCPRLG